MDNQYSTFSERRSLAHFIAFLLGYSLYYYCILVTHSKKVRGHNPFCIHAFPPHLKDMGKPLPRSFKIWAKVIHVFSVSLRVSHQYQFICFKI